MLVAPRSDIDSRQQLVCLAGIGRSRSLTDDVAQLRFCGSVLVQGGGSGSGVQCRESTIPGIQPAPSVVAFRRNTGLAYEDRRKQEDQADAREWCRHARIT